MPNVSGRAYALIVLTPVLPGRTAALQGVLDRFPTGGASPLARTGTTHFARWVIIDRLMYEGPPQQRDTLKSDYLLFSSHFDGALDTYLQNLRTLLPVEADAIWGHCVGYPGTGEPEAFGTYLRRNQLNPLFYFAAYSQATLPQVLSALELRERLLAFAVRVQGLDAAALQAAYLETFSAGGTHERRSIKPAAGEA